MSTRTLSIPAGLLAAAALFSAASAQAYEYALKFAPPGAYENLVVGGYSFSGSSVVGNCSYTAISSGSGRDPRTTYTPIPQTCTWDLYGNLLSIASGAPAVPAPLGTNGTETIYAMPSATAYTGYDAALPGGFVFTYGSHYAWLTSNAYMVLPQVPYTFTATLTSNGDTPLSVSAVKASVVLKGAKVVVNSNTCKGSIPVGGTCGVNLTYSFPRVTSTTGLAYDTLTIHLTSDAGQTVDFVQGYTDEVRVTPD